MKPTITNTFGTLTGWNSVTVNLLGRDLEGITAVSYDDTVSKANAYGSGKMPVGRTEGNYEAKASLDLLKEEVDGIQQSLPPGGRVQDIAPFDILVEYARKDGKLQTDIIRNAEFTNKAIEVKNGDGSISMKMELIVSHIDWNV